MEDLVSSNSRYKRIVAIMDRIKVVWVCSFSNPEIRNLFPKHKSLFSKLLKKQFTETDSAQWNTNGIKEFEKEIKDYIA